MTFKPTSLPALPRNVAAQSLSTDEAFEILKSKCGADAVLSLETPAKGDKWIVVEASKLIPVLMAVRDESKLLCQILKVVSATDFLPKEAEKGRIEVAYVVESLVHKHQICFKVKVDRDSGKVPSACEVYRSANWYERECYDMTGVEFTGHPNHERLLLPPDWVGHPLRKDYVFPEEYNGMKVPL